MNFIGKMARLTDVALGKTFALVPAQDVVETTLPVYQRIQNYKGSITAVMLETWELVTFVNNPLVYTDVPVQVCIMSEAGSANLLYTAAVQLQIAASETSEADGKDVNGGHATTE